MQKSQCLLFLLKRSYVIKKFGAIALSNLTFLLTILVQTFLLINNRMENWVWKSTEKTLFNFKVLESFPVGYHL